MNLVATNLQRKTLNAWQRLIFMTQHLPNTSTVMVKPLHGTKIGIYFNYVAWLFALDPFYHPFQVYWRNVGKEFSQEFQAHGVLRQLKQVNAYLEGQFAPDFDVTKAVPPLSRKQWQCFQLFSKLLSVSRQLRPELQPSGHRCWVQHHGNRLTISFEQGRQCHQYVLEYDPLQVPLCITWGYNGSLTQQPSYGSTIKFLKVMLAKIQSYC